MLDILFFESFTNTGTIYSVDTTGDIQLLRTTDEIGSHTTQIIPGDFTGGGATDLLCYESSGLDGMSDPGGQFYTVDSTGDVHLLTTYHRWTNWTDIIPGNFSPKGSTDLLFWSQEEREGKFYIVDATGHTHRIKTYTGWSDWDFIIPGNFTGRQYTDLLFYNRDATYGALYTSDGTGHIHLLKTYNDLPYAQKIVSGDFTGSGKDDLLFFNTGPQALNVEMEFHTIDATGDIHLLKQLDNEAPTNNVTVFTVGDVTGDNTTDLLFYDPATNLVYFYTVDATGDIHLLKQCEVTPSHWNQIIPLSRGKATPPSPPSDATVTAIVTNLPLDITNSGLMIEGTHFGAAETVKVGVKWEVSGEPAASATLQVTTNELGYFQTWFTGNTSFGICPISVPDGDPQPVQTFQVTATGGSSHKTASANSLPFTCPGAVIERTDSRAGLATAHVIVNK
jgi:hypothetical protein